MVVVSTDVDAPPNRRHHYRWLAVLVVLATVAAIGLLKVLDTGGPAAPTGAAPPSDGLPEALRTELATRLTKALEQSSPADHHNHGHEVAAGGTMVCAVDPFGVDPPSATTIDQVGIAYALHLCAVAEAGRDWDYSVRYSGPLTANFGDPPVVSVVQPGEGFADRVHTVIPQRYWDRATGPFRDEAALAELRRRFDAARR
jgi:hypothetical protein